jgi:hypothetical protein
MNSVNSESLRLAIRAIIVASNVGSGDGKILDVIRPGQTRRFEVNDNSDIEYRTDYSAASGTQRDHALMLSARIHPLASTSHRFRGRWCREELAVTLAIQNGSLPA